MYLIIKRVIDIVISLIGLIVLSPFLALIAIVIKVDSEGPVIFKQKRLGKDGKIFEIYKFRTMIVGAEQIGSGVYSAENDSRVSRVGRILRRLSIDELPQFINILKSEMALIGPRPPLTYHPWPLESYTDEQKKRFSVHPGVTGWAQVNGRKGIKWDKRIEFDVEYVENLSFLFDLKIFFKTIIKICTMEGNINTIKTAEKSTQSINTEVKV
ncbi:MAG: sugar transferase [Clostridiaceae bacterium]|nr:sugar transferase [Clostridiaceae bacterium]